MEYLSSLLTSMDTIDSRRITSGFGTWLESQFRARGMNQSEFARRLGVSQGTVSRWIAGRTPEAKFLDPIADVLVLDYDLVATRAGYRPRALLQVDPNSAEAELLPYIRAIRWEDHPRELAMIKRNLEFIVEVDRGEKDR